MKWINRIGLTLLVIALPVTLSLICHRTGLIAGLDFGSGQYYYTDIPNWEHYFSQTHFTSHLPLLPGILLFLLWGYAMLKLWEWVDKR